jgi:tRNA pseudouridine13 synthase
MNVEDFVGIRTYITKTEGINGNFKERCEDFQVEEITDLKIGDGKWTILRVKKINWDTMNLVRALSKRLKISQKRIRFAGTKDKRGVTIQYFSIDLRDEEMERLSRINIKDVEIEVLGKSNKPIQLGDLMGNSFRVTLRSVKNVESVEKTAEELKKLGTPNFFGLQRFGSIRFVTHEVGRYILRRDYESAFWTYVAKPFEGEREDVKEIREILWDTKDVKFGLRELPKYLRYERILLQKLREGKDERSALLTLPENLKTMFIHAYQSYVFNSVLSDRIEEFGSLKVVEKGDWVDFIRSDGFYTFKADFVKVTEHNVNRVRFLIEKRICSPAIPLPGYETPVGEDWTSQKVMEYLERDDLTLQDFKHEIKDFSSKGSFRPADLIFEHTGFDHIVKEDCVEFRFYLPKGCYATILLREFAKKPLA